MPHEANQVAQPDELIQPHNIQAEQEFLSGLLVRGDMFARIADRVDPGCFWRKAHSTIFATMSAMFLAGDPIDIASVSLRLKQAGSLDNIGGRQYLVDLAASNATTANLEWLADRLREYATRRRCINLAQAIHHNAHQEPDPSITLAKAQEELFKLIESHQQGRRRDNQQVLTDVIDALERRASGDTNPSILTGFPSLDLATGGFQGGELIIIGARPSMGKTSFAMAIANHNFSHRRKRVAILSLEMTRDQLTERLLASRCNIDGSALRFGRLAPHHWDSIAREQGVFATEPHDIYDQSDGLETLMQAIAKIKRPDQKPDMVIIDYLQLMNESTEASQGDTRTLELGRITRRLKLLALQMNIPIIVLSQLSRTVEARQIKKPMLSDLRDSGAIEQDCDIAMFLYRDDYYNPESEKKGEVEVIIAKHRAGQTTSVSLGMHASTFTFFDLSNSPYRSV